MKCLSLWQPWATLMAIGAKKVETRSWPLHHRGLLAIHASKKWSAELRDLCDTQPFASVLDRLTVLDTDPLPLGAIVGVVRVMDCRVATALNHPFGNEYRFGDYNPGRFMIETEDSIWLSSPIEYRGMQGLFEVPDEIFNRHPKVLAAIEAEKSFTTEPQRAQRNQGRDGAGVEGVDARVAGGVS